MRTSFTIIDDVRDTEEEAVVSNTQPLPLLSQPASTDDAYNSWNLLRCKLPAEGEEWSREKFSVRPVILATFFWIFCHQVRTKYIYIQIFALKLPKTCAGKDKPSRNIQAIPFLLFK